MPQVRIYRPAKTAMQSGRRKTGKWVIEYEPPARGIDPLMGWSSTADTRGQVRVLFDSKEAALAFAKKHGLVADVFDPQVRQIRPKSYASNFTSRHSF
jgi:NADH dehydrogenase